MKKMQRWLCLLIFLLLLGAPAPSCAQTVLFRDGFETNGVWTSSLRNGATGWAERGTRVRRNGVSSFCLRKTNGVGYLDMRSPVIRVKKNSIYTVRVWFRCDSAPLSSLFLLRVSNTTDGAIALPQDDNNYFHIMSQSLLRNSPKGKWEKRLFIYRSGANTNAMLHLIAAGNPCELWIDDVTFEEGEQTLNRPAGPHYTFPFTEAQVRDELARRTVATARVGKHQGHPSLFINDQPVRPVIYKGPYSSTSTGDFQGFAKQGIDLVCTQIKMCVDSGDISYFPPAPPDPLLPIWPHKGVYQPEQVDRAILSVLRKNPKANIILDLHFYNYKEWGRENPDECYRNAEGERAYTTIGATIAGFTKDAALVDNSNGQYWWYASHSSQKWREEMANAVRVVANRVKTSPYGKAVVGFFITGGQDLQWWITTPYDSSPVATRAFRDWLKQRYITVAALNSRWLTNYADFNEIAIPIPPDDPEGLPTHLGPGTRYDLLDYRLFRKDEMWGLRDYFAGIAKQTVGKPVIALSYAGGAPLPENFRTSANLDGVGLQPDYSPRLPGYTSGFKPISVEDLGDKILFAENDQRSWISYSESELVAQWVSAADTLPEWKSIFRKEMGSALANDFGYWFWDFYEFYNDSRIEAEIGAGARVARKLFDRPRSDFRPDVCFVIADSTWDDLSAPGLISLPASDVAFDIQYQMLKTSGVPYDVHLLSEVVSKPELQNYKVYIFHQIPLLTAEQRAKLKSLRKDRRTLVWLYNTGYLTGEGESIRAMSDLVGMQIATSVGYAKRTPLALPSGDALLKNLLPLQSGSELLRLVLDTSGEGKTAVTGTPRAQPFWVTDTKAVPLARFAETGQVASAVVRYDDFTSIYIASPMGLGSDLLHNIALEAGAFVAGKPGQQLDISGDFLSLHGLRSGRYSLTLPPGRTKVLDADTGAVLSTGTTYTFPVEVQRTYWFLFE